MAQKIRSIQVWYEQYANLIKTKDANKISDILDKGFKSIPPAGNVFNHKEYILEITREFSDYDFPQVNFNVLKVNESKLKIIVYLEKTLVSYDSRQRRYDSKIYSRETLKNINGSYKISEVDTICREVKIDGVFVTSKIQGAVDAMCQQCGNKSND